MIIHGKLHLVAVVVKAYRRRIKRPQACYIARRKCLPAKQFQNLSDMNMNQASFCRAVDEIKDYIAKGDIYQLLSRRARCRFDGSLLTLYLAFEKPRPFCLFE